MHQWTKRAKWTSWKGRQRRQSRSQGNGFVRLYLLCHPVHLFLALFENIALANGAVSLKAASTSDSARPLVFTCPGMYSCDDLGVGGRGGSEFPASHTLYSRFLTPSLVAPASVCFFYCEKLRNVAKFVSYFSRIPPPWVSRLLPSLLPPRVDFPPPLPPGSRYSFIPHLFYELNPKVENQSYKFEFGR